MEYKQVCVSMKPMKILTVAEQIAEHLKEEIALGSLSGEIPGRNELAKRYDVGFSSVEQALKQLEFEGILIAQGSGRMRRVAEQPARRMKRKLSIAILAYEDFSEGIFSEVPHALRESGHHAFLAKSNLLELGMDVRKVANLYKRTDSDAWIVCSGPRQVNEWFASQEKPAFALFGRRKGIPIASVGSDKTSAIIAATRRMIELGHRRIVMMARPDRRLPEPGDPEKAFLKELAAHGLSSASNYHLPDWEDGLAGFHSRMDELFRVTPPTALIVNEMKVFIAAQQFLGQRQLRAPEDISLLSMESDNSFDWCRPQISCIEWDRSAVIRRLMSWANDTARGKKDIREVTVNARFIEGGTIGRARPS